MTWESTGVGVAAPTVALIIGVITYRLSKRRDAIVEQSGVLTETRAGTAQIIEGMNLLMDRLQEDNRGFREDLHLLEARFEVVVGERDQCRHHLGRMMRRYGGDTPAGGSPTTDLS